MFLLKAYYLGQDQSVILRTAEAEPFSPIVLFIGVLWTLDAANEPADIFFLATLQKEQQQQQTKPGIFIFF